MKKKTLDFQARLAYRKNGLIDITSPDWELAGFRVTLKEGTDSHTIAAEALTQAGILPAPATEYYAKDLYADHHSPGVLVGLSEEGKPFKAAIPNSGNFIFIAGITEQAHMFEALLKSRIPEANSGTFDNYGRTLPIIGETITPDYDLSLSEIDDFLEAWFTEIAKTPIKRGTLRFVTFLNVEKTFQHELRAKAATLASLSIVPIIVSNEARAHRDDLVFFFPGTSPSHYAAEVPKPDEWLRTIPLDRSFISQPGDSKATRFRVL